MGPSAENANKPLASCQLVARFVADEALATSRPVTLKVWRTKEARMEQQVRGRAAHRDMATPQDEIQTACAEVYASGRLGDQSLPRPRRLISLREACARRGISVRSYWRDTTLLPMPIKGKGKHLFLEQEVDTLIERLLMTR